MKGPLCIPPVDSDTCQRKRSGECANDLGGCEQHLNAVKRVYQLSERPVRSTGKKVFVPRLMLARVLPSGPHESLRNADNSAQSRGAGKSRSTLGATRMPPAAPGVKSRQPHIPAAAQGLRLSPTRNQLAMSPPTSSAVGPPLFGESPGESGSPPVCLVGVRGGCREPALQPGLPYLSVSGLPVGARVGALLTPAGQSSSSDIE
jgi:hypothetical protein